MALQGIVSVLDAVHSAKVETLWAELEHELGLKYACVAYPHFSYQIAEAYDVSHAEPVLREFARTATPFHVVSSGLGIFTGERPVLYVRIVRDLELTRFHDALASTIAPYTRGVHAQHYGHEQWIPHITLGIQDLTHDNLPDAIRLLSRRPFNWDITITSLSLVLDARGTRDDWMHFPFGGASARG